jgi:Flp pilus assembly CpaE family ATPase
MERKMDANLRTKESRIQELATKIARDHSEEQIIKTADELVDVFKEVAEGNTVLGIKKITQDLIRGIKEDPIHAIACLIVWQDLHIHEINQE